MSGPECGGQRASDTSSREAVGTWSWAFLDSKSQDFRNIIITIMSLSKIKGRGLDEAVLRPALLPPSAVETQQGAF